MDYNPISRLQEHMVLNKKIIPNYTCIKEKNGTHINEFTMRVECDNLSVEASASSKKRAKTLAATKLLDLIQEEEKSMESSSEFDVISHDSDSSQNSLLERNFNCNYVGKLQELAVTRGVYPRYHVESVVGPCHNPIFTVTCTYKHFVKKASGNNKKIAKNSAAKEMFYHLTTDPEDLVLASLSISPVSNCPEDER